MEVSVRRIYTRNDQNEMALCFRGRKFANCVVVDYPIKVWTMPLRELETLECPDFQGKPYPVKRMADSLLTLAKKNGITVAAERLVRAALDGTHLSEEIIDAKPSENGEPTEPVKKSKRVKIKVGDKTVHEGPASDLESKPPKIKRTQKAKREKPAAIGRTPSIIGTLSEKYKLEPKDARKALRKAGMNAPYVDQAKIEDILSKCKAKSK